MNRLTQDATASLGGFMYQSYIALEKCFALDENEILYIEKYGDISIPGVLNAEVKHYESDLTDLSENFWKTIYNWINKDFDISKYKKLVLLTTQSFGKQCRLKKFNEIQATEKLEILITIRDSFLSQKKQGKNIKKFITYIFHNEEKLQEILKKFIVLTNQDSSEDIINNIKNIHLKSIPKYNQDKYLNALFGYINRPELKYEISYKNFKEENEKLTTNFCEQTKEFPRIGEILIDEESIEAHLEETFIKKIKEIEHNEVISEAIGDYLRTNKNILEDFTNYSISKNLQVEYSKELLKKHIPRYRGAKESATTSNYLKKSRGFYDNEIGKDSPIFSNFLSTPSYFRNGILHNLANEEEKFKWNLKPEDE